MLIREQQLYLLACNILCWGGGGVLGLSGFFIVITHVGGLVVIPSFSVGVKN